MTAPPHSIPISNGDFKLTQDAAAILAGVTVQTLINWDKLNDGPPRNADRSYSARDLGKWLVEVKAHRKSGPKSVKSREDPDDNTSFSAAERRLKLAQAIKIERENEIAAGNLIEIDKLEPIWQRILSRVRGALLKIPTALTPVVLGDTDAHSIQSKIKDAVHDALTNLSEDWRDEESDDVE
jgi:phage terminase Nu1 subunit (DNA packaging protein)